jgi:hypothetical protein
MRARKPRIVALAAALAGVMIGCGGGTRVVETGVTPTRVAPAQPMRDASGQIVTQEVTLPEGTVFTALTMQTLSSKTAGTGDPVMLEVADNVRVNDVVVITAGTPVRAVVSDVRHAGRMGQSGNLNLRLESTTAVDGQTVGLRATRFAAADNTTGTTVALAVVVSPLFLLRKGREIEYRPLSPITVYTASRMTVRGWNHAQ